MLCASARYGIGSARVTRGASSRQYRRGAASAVACLAGVLTRRERHGEAAFASCLFFLFSYLFVSSAPCVRRPSTSPLTSGPSAASGGSRDPPHTMLHETDRHRSGRGANESTLSRVGSLEPRSLAWARCERTNDRPGTVLGAAVLRVRVTTSHRGLRCAPLLETSSLDTLAKLVGRSWKDVCRNDRFDRAIRKRSLFHVRSTK